LGCFINIFDEKNMPVIIGLFIGRWSSVVNVKLPEDRYWNSEAGMRPPAHRGHGAYAPEGRRKKGKPKVRVASLLKDQFYKRYLLYLMP
jgi:hypothetical protein